MRAGHVIDSLAAALYRAVDKDLPDIHYDRMLPGKRGADGNSSAEPATRRPLSDEVEVYHFSQTWGSTALGFGGVCGQSMTSAYTTVVISEQQNAAVYFAGRLAYVIRRINNEFWSDLRAFDMAACGKAKKYLAPSTKDSEVT